MRNWSLMKGSIGRVKKRCGNQPIIHRYGKAMAAQNWLYAQGKFKGRLKKPKELTIITMHNYTEPPLFEVNLKYLGIKDYVVLRPPDGPWKYTYKIIGVRDFIKNGGCKTEYLLFCDARDCVITDEPQKIVDIFESFTCKLLFGTTLSTVGCYGNRGNELFGWPLASILRCWANRTGVHRRYLNSGVFIGKPVFIEEFLSYAVRYSTDIITYDQGIFRALQPMFHPYLKLDYANDLVYRN